MGFFFFFFLVCFLIDFMCQWGRRIISWGIHVAFLTVHPVILEHLIGLFDALQ